MQYLKKKKKPPKNRRAQRKLWFPRFRVGISKGGGGDFSRKECRIVVLISMDTSTKGGKGMRSDALGSR